MELINEVPPIKVKGRTAACEGGLFPLLLSYLKILWFCDYTKVEVDLIMDFDITLQTPIQHSVIQLSSFASTYTSLPSASTVAFVMFKIIITKSNNILKFNKNPQSLFLLLFYCIVKFVWCSEPPTSSDILSNKGFDQSLIMFDLTVFPCHALVLTLSCTCAKYVSS